MNPTALGHWTYLPFLLVWALPVIGVQWLLGGRYLWRERRVWPWVALGLGAYFTLADAAAILAGAWSFDRRALTGFTLGPVPIEEVLFYLLTALMCVQGFVTLWFGYEDRTRLSLRFRQRLARLRRLFGTSRGARLSSGLRPDGGASEPTSPPVASRAVGPADGQ